MQALLNPPQVVQLDPPQLFDLLGPLKDFFKWMIAELYKLASSIATALTEYVVTPILNALKWLFDKISSLVSSSISQVLNFLREKAPITPEKAWDLLPYVVGLATAGALSVGAYFTALNIQVAGSGLRVDPLARFIERLLSPDIVVTFTLGAILAVAFKTPLTYWANAIFRPSLPSPREAYSMMVKGIISREEFLRIMRYVGGYSEFWINALEKEWNYTPGAFEVMRLADYTSLDPIWVARKLRDLGMSETDIGYYLEAIIRRPLREEVRSLTSEILYHYIYGWMDKETVVKILGDLKLKKEEIDLLVARAEFYRKRRLLEQRVDIFTEMFRKGLIDASTFETKLKELGLAVENVNLIVAYEKAKKGIAS
jgi:hypothetical protein